MLKHVSAIVAAALLTAVASRAHAQVVEVQPDEHAYDARTDAQIRSWIHENNREATDEERSFVDAHWRRAARLWRIRHLAEQAHDAATVARVEALMLRADRILEQQMRKYREHAPVMAYEPPEVEVTTAPPPPQPEVQTAIPGPGYVWTPGYWHWNGARHVWMGGHWQQPPQPGFVWEPAKWENRGGRWGFNEGRWRMGAAPAPNVVYEPPPAPVQEVVVETAPPPPLVEVRPAGPPNGVWIPGYWQWNGGRHTWVGGRWSAARPGMRWEPDHWVRSGRGYARVQGRWVR